MVFVVEAAWGILPVVFVMGASLGVLVWALEAGWIFAEGFRLQGGALHTVGDGRWVVQAVLSARAR